MNTIFRSMTRALSAAILAAPLLIVERAMGAESKPDSLALKSHGGLHLTLTTLNGGNVPLDLISTATYTPDSLRFTAIQSGDLNNYPTVMCFGSGGAFSARLTDRNGYQTQIGTFTSFRYNPDQQTQFASGGSRCYSVEPFDVVDADNTLDRLPPVDTDTFCESQAGGPPGDTIFAGGFESEGGSPGSSDVRLAVELVNSPNPDSNPVQPLIYDIYAFNCGDTDATGVTVRDFVPVENGVNTDTVRFGTAPDRALCEHSDSGMICSTELVQTALGGDTPYVLVDGVTLPARLPGNPPDYVKVTIERTVAVGTFPQRARLSFGVDAANDGDRTDNTRYGDVIVVSNNAPDILVLGTGEMMIDEDRPLDILVTRDDPDLPVPVEVSATDPDDDNLVDMSLIETNQAGVPINDKLVSLTIDGSVPGTDPTAGPFQVLITPGQDQSGTAYATVLAEDAQGAVGQFPITLTIREINDAPTFQLYRQPATREIDGGGVEEVIVADDYCTARGNQFDGGIDCDQSYLVTGDAAVLIEDFLIDPTEGAVSTAELGQTLHLESVDPQDAGYPTVLVTNSHDLKDGSGDFIVLPVYDTNDNAITLDGSIFSQWPQVWDSNGDGIFDLLLAFRPATLGDAVLKFRVVDDGGTDLGGVDTTEVSIQISVTDNSAPTMVAGPGSFAALDEDQTPTPITLTGVTLSADDAEGPIKAVRVTSQDLAIINDDGAMDGDHVDLNPNITVDITDPADIVVMVTPEANAFGSVDLEFVSIDQAGNESAPLIRTLVINGINDPPSVVFGDEASIEADGNVVDFTPGTNTLTLNNNQTIGSVPGFLQATGDAVLGPAEGTSQALQAVNIVVDSDPSGVFSGTPVIELNGDLLFGLTSNSVTGSTLVSVTVVDDGGGMDTSSTVQIQIDVVD